jgi:filamentous hemagglutinin family protein
VKHAFVLALSLILSLAGLAYAEPAVNALPTGGLVVSGDASIATSGATLNVNQTSQRAIVNWDSFNVGQDATVNFNHPNSSASTLNRISSGTPSQIYGKINAIGEVILQNTAGVYFSKSASLDVGSIAATTHSISNDDYNNGKYHFDRNGSTGSVINEGNIKAGLNGYVAMLAPEVRNSGLIVAQMGTVVMAAGERVTLNFDTTSHLASITTTPATINTLIENKSAVTVNGGTIILSSKALNTLVSSLINHSGSLDASNETTKFVSVGGRIVIEGDEVNIASASSTLAKGSAGGGDISISASRTLTIVDQSKIDASAIDSGHGGTIKTNAPITMISGELVAQGGSQSGNGGTINTTASTLSVSSSAIINASTSNGDVGSWNITSPEINLNQTFANVISATLNHTNVALNTLKSVQFNLAETITNMTGKITYATEIILEKTSAITTSLTMNAEGSLNVSGSLKNTFEAPLDLILQSSDSIILTSSAQLAARQMKLSAPVIIQDGNIFAYGGTNSNAPLLALLGARIAITGTMRAGSTKNSGSIKIEGDNDVTINSNASISTGNDLGGSITVLSSSGDINISYATLKANGLTDGGQITIVASHGDVNFQQSFIQTNGGAGVGGTILLSGVNNTLISSTEISATGYIQGGTIKIGYDATNQTLPFSSFTHINSASVINANQLDTSSSNVNGGYIETSGQILSMLAAINAGRGGMWLLDPYDVTIAGSGTTGTTYSASFTAGETTTILASSINTSLNAGTNVSITTGSSSANTIYVNSEILATTGSATLTLTGGTINLAANITTRGSQTYTGAVVINNASGITLTSNNSNITFSSTVNSVAGNYYGLTISNGTGTTTFSGIVGASSGTSALGYLCINATSCSTSSGVAPTLSTGTTILSGNVTTNGTQIYGGGVTLNGAAISLTTNDGLFNIVGALDVVPTVTTSSNILQFTGGGNYTYNGTVNAVLPSSAGTISWNGTSYTWTPSTSASNSRLLIVGGGGGGTSMNGNWASGAGGGGVIYDSAYTVLSSLYTITIGAGGARNTNTNSDFGGSGGNTSVVVGSQTLIAFGGGGAKKGDVRDHSSAAGQGGSSSGAIPNSYANNVTTTSPAGTKGSVSGYSSGTLITLGNAGGSAVTNSSWWSSGGGGGGGAGGAGTAGYSTGQWVMYGGNGGAGYVSSITGTSVTYASGVGGCGGSGCGSSGTGAGVTTRNADGLNWDATSSSTPGSGGANGGNSSVKSGQAGVVVIDLPVSTTSYASTLLTINAGTGKASIGGSISNISTLAINSKSALSAVSGAIGGATLVSYNTATGYTGSSGAAGVLNLSGANTYTGGTTVTGGTLQAGSTTAFGASTSAIRVNTDAALDLNGKTLTNTNALTLNGSGVSSAGALTNSSSTAATYAGLITLGSASTINASSGNIVISNTGTILGATYGLTLTGTNTASSIASIIGTTSGTLTKSGLGTWTVSGANTYTGLTTISAGTLKLGAAGGGTNTPLGTTGAGTTVSDGATLDLNGFTLGTAEGLTINGAGQSSAGALTNSSSTAATYAGLITLGSASTINASSGNIVISNTGTILGATYGLTLTGTNTASSIASIIGTTSGTLTKSGLGTWTVSGANTFTGGTTISAGTLIASSSALALGGGSVTLGASTGSSSSALRVATTGLTYNNPIILSSGTSGELSIGNTGTSISTTFSGGVTGTNNLVISAGATNGTVSFATGSLNNAGTITNSGSGSGTTTISAAVGSNVTGITQSSSTSALAISGAITPNVSGSTFINSGTSTLTLSGGISGTGNVIFNNNSSGTITASTTSINNTGTITNSGSGSGTTTISAAVGSNVTGIIQSSSTSALAISGAITPNVSGSTFINSGTSTLTLSGGISGTGNVTFNNNSSGTTTVSGTSINNTGTITNSGSGSGATTISAVVGSNVTGVIQNGSSPLILSGTNTFTGSTTITTGTLKAASAAALSTRAVSIGASGILDLTFSGTVALGSTLSMSTGAAITNSANTSNLTVAGASTLNGNINTVGNQTYTGAVTLGANTALTTLNTSSANTNGTITFSSTLDSTAGSYYGLSITNGTGTAAFGGIVGASSGTSALGYLCINASGCSASTVGTSTGSGTSTLANNVTTSGNQTYGGAVIINNSSGITLTASSNNGTVSFGSTVNSYAATTYALTISNGTGATTFTGPVGATNNLRSLTLNGTGTITLGGNVTTAGDQTYAGPVSAAAGIVISANAASGSSGILTYGYTSNSDYAYAFQAESTNHPWEHPWYTFSSGTSSATIGTTITGNSAGILFYNTTNTAGAYNGMGVAGGSNSSHCCYNTPILVDVGRPTLLESISVSQRANDGITQRLPIAVTVYGSNTEFTSSKTLTIGGTAHVSNVSFLGVGYQQENFTTIGSGNFTTLTNSQTPALSNAVSFTNSTAYRYYQIAFTSYGKANLAASYGAPLALQAINLVGSTYAPSSATFNGAITASGALTINTGALTAANIAAGGALTINNSATGSVTGVISNNGSNASLVKQGAGTLTLSGNNTYSGSTTISEGTLNLGTGGTSGSITGNVINNATLNFNRSDALTYAGAISGSGSVTKQGAGTLTLSGDNTYNGSTTISEGTLNLGEGGETGSITGNVINNATLNFNRSDALTYAGVISGSGSVTKQGTGTLTLSGANTYTGLTTISAGTLKLGATGGGTNTPLGTTSAGTIVSNGATLDLNGFNLGTTEALTLNGAGFNSVGALTNSSSTAATYTGAITLGSDSAMGSTAGAITVSGAIGSTVSAYKLALVGNKAITLSSATNTLSTIASGSGVGALSITNNQALTIGSLTIGLTTYSGLSSTGTILVQTSTGNLTVNNAVTTTSTSAVTSAPAIKLAAGFNDATSSTINNIILGSSSSNLITAGSGAIIALYSGAPLSSTNLGSFVAGQSASNTSYGVTTTTGSLASGAGYYALYRGTQPTMYVIFGSSDTPTYGSAPTITYSFNTLANGTGTQYSSSDTATVNATGTALFKGTNSTTSTTNVSLNSSANAGSYTTVTYLSGLSSPIYALSAGSSAGSLTISKADAYVIVGAEQSSTYGETPTISYTYYNNAAGTGGAAITSPTGLSGTPTITNAPTSSSDAGTYSLTYASGLSSTNYTFNAAASSTSYTVNKAQAYVIIGAGQSSNYGVAPTISLAYYNNAAGTGNAITSPAGLLGTATITNAPTASSNAGTYSLTYASGLSSTNYAFNAATSARSYTVNPAVLNITLSKTYDGTTSFTNANTYTLSGTRYNSDAMPTIASGTAATSSANAASYTSFASNGLTLSNTNYTLTNGTVAATINPAPLGIAIGGVYSGSTTITPATYTITGLVSAETLVPTSVTVSNANVSSNGSNYVTAILSKTGTATLSNYAITSAYNATSATNTTNTATLTAAPLGLAVTGTYSGLYNLVPSSVVTEGLLGSDTLTGLSSVTLKYKDVANNGTNFVLSATGVSGTAVLSNYAITAAYNTASTTTKNIATLTAAPLGISVTAPYSGSTVILTPTIDENKTFGLVNGETLTGLASVTLYSANVSANGSNYVTAASGAVGTATLSNYSLTSAYNNADTSTRNKATITPATLKVTAVDSSKFVTQSDPVGYGGITYSGWVAGQGASVLDVTGLTISRSNPSENAATYALIPSGLSANAGNYTFNYQAGTFTIIPADTLAVSVASTSSVYGTAPTYVISSAKYLSAGTSTIYTLSPTVTGSVVTMTDGANGSATFTLTPISTSGASSITSGSGNYKVDAYTLSATNKTIVSNNFSQSIVVTGSLTVSPVGLDASNLSVTGLSKVYDGTTNVSGLTLSASSNIFVNGDTVSVIGTGNFADTNVASSKAITITPALSGADASNYYFSGTNTIGTSGTITQLASVTYDGLSGGNWSNASNWTGGAIPTLSNVGTVIIPSGKTVVYDTTNLSVLTPTSAITNNGSINFNDSTPLTFANNISGTGAVALTGSGVVTLTGNNTYSGGTTIASGSSLIVGGTNALGTGSLTSSGGSFEVSSGVILSSLNMTGAVTLNSDITTLGTQTYNGPVTLGKTLTLSAPSSTITFNNTIGNTTETYASYVTNRGSINPYNLTVLANRININADITTYGTQTYGSSLSYTSVYIGGAAGRRVLISEDPAVTFWGTIDDATANTHDLVIKAVCYLSCTNNDLPTIDFKSDIGLIAPLLSLEATTGRQETSGSPTFAQTSLNSSDYVGNVSIMGDVTTKLNQTYTGKKINLGDGTSNQIQTFATTGGNVTFNYGTDGTIPSNSSLSVKFDLNGGTHTTLNGVNVLQVSNTSSNSNIIDGGQILKTILNTSSNRQLPISKDGSYIRARVDVLDPIFKCNSQVTTKECI